MKNDLQIIPTILASDENEYRKKVDIINSAPEFETGIVQIDITDGEFCKNKSVGLDIINKYPINHNIEVHLMVQKPLDWIDDLFKLKAKRIIIPLESDQVDDALNKVRNLGLEVGLSINPETSADKIILFVGNIDVLLILSVHPGLGGQEFIPETIDKIKKANELKGQYGFKIEVDGGIIKENVKDIVEAGADGIVIGEHLIYGDIRENLEKIREQLNS